jgi:hypothetical protein
MHCRQREEADLASRHTCMGVLPSACVCLVPFSFVQLLLRQNEIGDRGAHAKLLQARYEYQQPRAHR